MDKDKSLGSNSFSMLFFQECWEILKRDLMEVFEEFYERGIISKGMNATFIVLIPKKKDTSYFLDFRPISLVGSLYKIISKVLSIRLRGVMDKVISNLQGAFVKGKQIMDGILIANVDGRKKRRESGLVCKVDMEKAYNRVDWDFLQWVIEKKSFGKRWIEWIKGCLDHPHFSIMINGTSKRFCSSSRGIRRGDPLSPFLFTLVADAFSALMVRAENHSIIEGFLKGSSGLSITHL